MYNMEETKNKIICGDNLEVMREIPDESVDLIYLDPPFFSNATYEKIWGDKDEIRSFEDRWKGGINVYTEWMSDRLKEMQRILKSTGTIYLHCDYHASHYLKVEMDKIFGEKNFQTEIIWQRSPKAWGSKASKELFPQLSENILVYTKSDIFIYNPIFVQYSDEYKKQYKLNDNDGNGFYKWDHYTGDNPNEQLLKRNESTHELKFSKESGRWYYKCFLKNKEIGYAIGNVWTDIHRLTSNRGQHNYPTQKPEKLLERILSASSNPGDTVLDPFLGGGTTAVVAKRLKRNFIGIDISLVGAKVAAKRIGLPEKDIIGLPSTMDDLKKMNPWEFQQWACDKMQARNLKPKGGSDGGIDGIISMTSRSIFDDDKVVKNKYNGCPIQVKQSESVGRPVIDNFKSAIEREGKNYGFVIAFSFAKPTYEEVARLKNEGSINIKLLTAEELCKDEKYRYEE